MVTVQKKTPRRVRRHRRVRKRVYGTVERPRLCVVRSLRDIYAQIIDDDAGRTLVQADARQPNVVPDGTPCGTLAAAHAVGRAIGQRAKDAGIARVVFDRSGYL